MEWVPGFDKQILESLANEDEKIRYEAVCAAGSWSMDGAWPYIERIILSEDTDKELLLAAIEAAPNIRPREVGMLLVDLVSSDDEDVSDAAEDAMRMAEIASGLDDEWDEDVRW